MRLEYPATDVVNINGEDFIRLSTVLRQFMPKGKTYKLVGIEHIAFEASIKPYKPYKPETVERTKLVLRGLLDIKPGAHVTISVKEEK